MDFLFALAKHSKIWFCWYFYFLFSFLSFFPPNRNWSISGPSYQISISDGFVIENVPNNSRISRPLQPISTSNSIRDSCLSCRLWPRLIIRFLLHTQPSHCTFRKRFHSPNRKRLQDFPLLSRMFMTKKNYALFQRSQDPVMKYDILFVISLINVILLELLPFVVVSVSLNSICFWTIFVLTHYINTGLFRNYSWKQFDFFLHMARAATFLVFFRCFRFFDV